MLNISEWHRMNERHKKLAQVPRRFLFIARCDDRSITVEGDTREQGRAKIEAIRRKFFEDHPREAWTVSAFPIGEGLSHDTH